MVLICAKEDDAHARRVGELLRVRHSAEPIVFDTSAYPGGVTLSAGFENSSVWLQMAVQERRIPLDQIRAIWWRRPQPVDVDSRIEGAETRSFTFHECISGLYGILRCSEALWVNDFDRDSAAEYKPYQLKIAAEEGFTVPETLITSEPELVSQFWQKHNGNVVYKAFNQRGVVWTPTRLLRQEDFAAIANLRFAPVIFQRNVPGIRDIRVTVVGNEIFATEFNIEGIDAIDYRVKMQEIAFEPHILPGHLEKRVLAYMRRLGLEYSALDLRLTPQGDYVFFEINTAGEFLYVEDRTGQPIAAAIAAHLAGGKAARSSVAPASA